MPSLRLLVTKLLLNPGELVVQSPVFLELLEEVLTDLAREPSETCVVEEECSLLPRPGEDGTDLSTLTKRDTLLPLLWLLQLSLLWSKPVVTELRRLPRFPSSFPTALLRT